MKILSLVILLVTTNAMAQTVATPTPAAPVSVWGESIHCEKGVFMSDNRSTLDIILENEAGVLTYGKVKKETGALELYIGQIKLVKTYQDAKRLELNDVNNGSDKATAFKLNLKFKKLIDADTLEYDGEVKSDKRNMGGLTCVVAPIEIKK